MKKFAFILLTFIISASGINAQQKMSDKDLEGLKGPVRSVIEEFQEINKFGGEDELSDKIESSHTFFDRSGQIERVIYKNSGYEITFSVIDGFKTFLRSDGDALGANSFDPNDDPLYAVALEKPEKLTPPDARFHQRFAYEYDKSGRAIAERHYANNGKLIRIRKFKYDQQGRRTELRQEEFASVSTYKYSYNKDGMLTGTSLEIRRKDNGVRSRMESFYTDIKTDEHGNWTERKWRQMTFFEADKKTGLEADTSETNSIEYRTIEYH